MYMCLQNTDNTVTVCNDEDSDDDDDEALDMEEYADILESEDNVSYGIVSTLFSCYSKISPLMIRQFVFQACFVVVNRYFPFQWNRAITGVIVITFIKSHSSNDPCCIFDIVIIPTAKDIFYRFEIRIHFKYLALIF